MPWFSILPAQLNIVETWIVRIFLVLGFATIGPWALFLLYDMILYIVRAVAYEVPYYGGRARGRRRPQAPTLTERPDGRKRVLSISGTSGSGTDEKEGSKRRGSLDSDEADDITEEESRAVRSTDLWDASTDSRFRSGVEAVKKRR